MFGVFPVVRAFVIVLVSTIALLVPGTTSAELIHFYGFDIGANPRLAYDSVGDLNGDLIGPSVLEVGNSRLGTGNGGYVQFPTHIIPTTGSFTVSLWENLQSWPPGFAEIISQGVSGPGSGFYIGMDPNHVIRATDSGYLFGAFPERATGFHHFMLTWDEEAGSGAFYVDGVQRGSNFTSVARGAGGTPTRLGRQFEGSLEFFDGYTDGLAIYDSALTTEDAVIIWSNGRDAAAYAPATNSTNVPEPASHALFGLALAVLGFLRRRRY